VGSLFLLVLAGGGTAVGASNWEGRSWLTVATGHESDLVLDPDLVRFTVPGGRFLRLAPGVILENRLSKRSRLRITGRMDLERFDNIADRSLFASALKGELLVHSRTALQLRLAIGGSYFTDSGRSSVRRYDGGLEAGLGYWAPRWRVEVLGGVQGRRYPNLLLPDQFGTIDTYAEGSMSLGLSGGILLAPSLSVSGQLVRLGTAARDPVFNSEAWTLEGSAWLQAGPRTWLIARALRQDRDFTSRLPGEDEDRYTMIGAEAEHDLSDWIGLSARYAHAVYTRPAGDSIGTDRISLAVTVRFGRSANRLPLERLSTVFVERPEALREGTAHTFRLRAPGAKRVSLVGDFNGWDPAADSMHPEGADWWELAISLPAGSHQYAFLVDGELLTPPDANSTVKDGFGGRNGLITVLRAGP
jgi:hypothetical protein